MSDTPSRMRTLTRKVPTPFGGLYVHVSVDAEGVPREVAISTPGKHHDTAVHEALIALGEGITACLPDSPEREEMRA